jgi:hypothetical protein
MTATKNKVPPSSTLVMTDLVPRNIPSSKTCTLRSPVRFQSTERTPYVLLLLRKPDRRTSESSVRAKF